MKSFAKGIFLSLLLGASMAHAAGSGSAKGIGILYIVFLVFGATVVVFQLWPGLSLLSASFRGLFFPQSSKSGGAFPRARQ